jgi:hypothetical protein
MAQFSTSTNEEKFLKSQRMMALAEVVKATTQAIESNNITNDVKLTAQQVRADAVYKLLNG